MEVLIKRGAIRRATLALTLAPRRFSRRVFAWRASACWSAREVARHGRIAVAIAVLLFAHPSHGYAEATLSRESQLKAAFLYNFTKFVDWPAQRFAQPSDPFVLGIWGSEALTRELEAVVRGRKAAGRDIAVRSIGSLADANRSHLVFVPATETARSAAIAEMHDHGVLTVGETELFAAAGGIITFALHGEKLRFAINLKTGERAKLKISAQLLKLASAVHH